MTDPAVMALGKTVIPAGTGTVLRINPDPYGKTSRKIALIKGYRGKKFEMFASALQVVGRKK